MATKTKRLSMAEALKGREDVLAFLEEGRLGSREGSRIAKPVTTSKPTEERIAVTLRLPKEIAHALIDASAERRKNRAKDWSQQDIVAEALNNWLRQWL